jgi:hypothetical protein
LSNIIEIASAPVVSEAAVKTHVGLASDPRPGLPSAAMLEQEQCFDPVPFGLVITWPVK